MNIEQHQYKYSRKLGFSVRMILLGVVVYILRSLALEGFFGTAMGRGTTIMFSGIIIGFAIYKWINDRKRCDVQGTEQKNEVEDSEPEISNVRFAVTVSIGIALISGMIGMLIWMMNYGVSQGIMTVSEGIYLSVCGWVAFYVCRIITGPICCWMSRVRLRKM